MVPCTLQTVHCTLYTGHCTLHTLHCTLYTAHCTMHNVHCTLYNARCTLHTVHYTLYTAHYTLHTVHCTLYTAHCTLHYTAHNWPVTVRSRRNEEILKSPPNKPQCFAGNYANLGNFGTEASLQSWVWKATNQEKTCTNPTLSTTIFVCPFVRLCVLLRLPPLGSERLESSGKDLSPWKAKLR